MGSNIDDAKGKVKEAAGDLTDDDQLKTEGKADQFGAEVKEMGEKVSHKISEGVDKLKDKLHR